MILNNSSHYSILPGTLICQPSCVLSFPSSVEVEDSWLNGGSGVGDGSSSIKAAIGEYFERRHFYMEVMPNVVGNINHSLTSVEAEKFVFAFSQTNDNDLTSAQLFSHSYNLTKVSRTSDFSICHIPTACISLNYHKIESENPIYPLRDTCGCSFHWCFESASFGAIKESLERQFLSRFWLTRECRSLIADQNVKEALFGSGAKSLYEALNKSGELSVMDISDPDYPGFCILTVYGQNNKQRHVQYCAGMSYAKTLAGALEKSIYELWQTYRFIDLFRATERDIGEVKDPYLKHFLNCNTYDTYEEITRIKLRGMAITESRFDFSLSGLLAALKVRRIDGYLYVNSLILNDNIYFFCKFVSPDFFLHMNNSKGINTHNKYSQGFVDQMVVERKNIMVPFP
ncbi:YcaO-like family protein [Pseudomonas putida]|jgi:ribosomal protein S12 methylthiotransferase accessory factor YcaO|uniref:YcaO-like family protein n=1 Tax=Pseudomonas putida TaxID=303 RepID=UPI0023638B56|nr:YcaO-like family protein [Pseudomonas putida]MDD2102400.1 YcaO-like family protein [Pseudomonas putida]